LFVSKSNDNVIDVLKDSNSDDIYLVIVSEGGDENYDVVFHKGKESVTDHTSLARKICYCKKVNMVDKIDVYICNNLVYSFDVAKDSQNLNNIPENKAIKRFISSGST
jgi:hypothetical protein